MHQHLRPGWPAINGTQEIAGKGVKGNAMLIKEELSADQIGGVRENDLWIWQ